MGMSAAHCQGISECLESGHPGYYFLKISGSTRISLQVPGPCLIPTQRYIKICW